jgi:hypothetical protein
MILFPGENRNFLKWVGNTFTKKRKMLPNFFIDKGIGFIYGKVSNSSFWWQNISEVC